MLVACRLAGLSALETHYADDNAQAQSGVGEQQERRRPRPSEGHARPVTFLLGAHLIPSLVPAKMTPLRSPRRSGWRESGSRRNSVGHDPY
jgi:hypothetical protein